MKISGFTIVRNAIQFQYPVLQSIRSILPICDEFVVNVGDSDDQTLALIQSLNNSKIRILQTKWDFGMGKEVLSFQTNLALKACTGDWAFYLQSDEVIHEADLEKLARSMTRWHADETVDALRFRWLHFYGSYYRYRIDSGWYQKQDRIIRNNGRIESQGDAWGFRRKDGRPLRRQQTGCLLYHYGWVHAPSVMTQRRVNAERIGFVTLKEAQRARDFSYGDLSRFPVYFGSHPREMKALVEQHPLSREDLKIINRKYWWHPFKITRARVKTQKWLEPRN